VIPFRLTSLRATFCISADHLLFPLNPALPRRSSTRADNFVLCLPGRFPPLPFDFVPLAGSRPSTGLPLSAGANPRRLGEPILGPPARFPILGHPPDLCFLNFPFPPPFLCNSVSLFNEHPPSPLRFLPAGCPRYGVPFHRARSSPFFVFALFFFSPVDKGARFLPVSAAIFRIAARGVPLCGRGPVDIVARDQKDQRFVLHCLFLSAVKSLSHLPVPLRSGPLSLSRSPCECFTVLLL